MWNSSIATKLAELNFKALTQEQYVSSSFILYSESM